LNRASKLPLGRLAAEFLVVVVGVLVALGVDRWVAAMDERELESSFLTALRDDFVVNRALAENGARVEGERAELAVELLESLGERGRTEHAARNLLAAESTGWVYYASYAEGAWSDLQSTGNSLIIRDASLRRGIADFYRELQWASELENQFKATQPRRHFLHPSPENRFDLGED